MTPQHTDHLACLAAIAQGARSEGDVAARCGWSIQYAGAVLLACERIGYIPTDSDGERVFRLTDAARVVAEFVDTPAPATEQGAYIPPSANVRAWLRKAGNGGTG